MLHSRFRAHSRQAQPSNPSQLWPHCRAASSQKTLAGAVRANTNATRRLTTVRIPRTLTPSTRFKRWRIPAITTSPLPVRGLNAIASLACSPISDLARLPESTVNESRLVFWHESDGGPRALLAKDRFYKSHPSRWRWLMQLSSMADDC